MKHRLLCEDACGRVLVFVFSFEKNLHHSLYAKVQIPALIRGFLCEKKTRKQKRYIDTCEIKKKRGGEWELGVWNWRKLSVVRSR